MFIIEELVKRAKEGEPEAMKEIIERYNYFIMKEAGKYHVPFYEYEDLVQHGYLSVIRAVKMYTLGRNSFDGYCLSSIKMNFKALLKGEIKHFREIPHNELADINTDPVEFTIEDQIIAYDEVKKLYSALDTLNEIERAVVERFYLREDTLKEIACDMEKDYYKVFSIKDMALKKLKRGIDI